MKYEITIEGGFTGIPKRYAGALDPEGDDARLLRSAIDCPAVSSGRQWPDAFQYRITLSEGSSRREAHFTEADLPMAIREFIDSLKNRGDMPGASPEY